jgi:hypothetical protein
MSNFTADELDLIRAVFEMVSDPSSGIIDQTPGHLGTEECAELFAMAETIEAKVNDEITNRKKRFAFKLRKRGAKRGCNIMYTEQLDLIGAANFVHSKYGLGYDITSIWETNTA